MCRRCAGGTEVALAAPTAGGNGRRHTDEHEEEAGRKAPTTASERRCFRSDSQRSMPESYRLEMEVATCSSGCSQGTRGQPGAPRGPVTDDPDLRHELFDARREIQRASSAACVLKAEIPSDCLDLAHVPLVDEVLRSLKVARTQPGNELVGLQELPRGIRPLPSTSTLELSTDCAKVQCRIRWRCTPESRRPICPPVTFDTQNC